MDERRRLRFLGDVIPVPRPFPRPVWRASAIFHRRIVPPRTAGHGRREATPCGRRAGRFFAVTGMIMFKRSQLGRKAALRLFMSRRKGRVLMFAALKKMFDPSGKELKRLRDTADRINALEPEIERLTDDELRAKTGEFKERLRQGAALDDLLPEAFACVREAAKRTLGQRHYDTRRSWPASCSMRAASPR